MIVALTRIDVASYVSALIWIYTVLIIVRILLTWGVTVPAVVRALQSPVPRAIVGFIEDVTDPYLGVFRRIMPPIRSGAGLIDISPIIALIALQFVGQLVVTLIHG